MTTVKYFLFSICLLFTSWSFAQNFEWAAQLNANNSNTRANNTAVDPSGNVFMTGEFMGAIDMDPGPGVQTLNSAGDWDVFLQKLSPTGSLLWGFRIGNTDYDEGNAVTTDAQGNVYLGGVFTNTVDFNPLGVANNVTSTNAGRDAFIAKYDPMGQLVWVKTLVGNDWDYVDHLHIDAQGNVYAGGRFGSTPTDFDPGPGVFNLSNRGFLSGFVLKLDNMGNFEWARDVEIQPILSLDVSTVTGVATAPNGDVFVTGNYRGAIDLNLSAGVLLDTSQTVDRYDCFVVQLNASGNFIQGSTFKSDDNLNARGIVVDRNSNVYIAGDYRDSVDFDPSPTNEVWSYNSSTGLFIQKLGPTIGQLEWVYFPSFRSLDIAMDPQDNIYLAGNFSNTQDFDLGPDTFLLTSNGAFDAFVVKIDPQANFQWAQSTGGTRSDQNWAVAVGLNGEVATCGIFQDVVDFDPGPDTLQFTASGFGDPFVQKYSQLCPPQTTNFTQSACDSFTWRNTTYTTSGIYTDTLQTSGGCDSFLVLNLTINNATTDTDVQTACSTYTWIDGITYTTSNNTAMFTLTNAAGCDSVVTLDLTIVNLMSSTTVQIACDRFTWRGTTLTTSGIYTDTIQASNGCDSVLILNLTISNAPPTGFTNNSTAAGTATLSWDAAPGAVDYELRYRIIGQGALGVAPTYVITANPSITLNNLEPNICYEYSARTRCGSGSVGPWSTVQNFCVAGGPNGFCARPSTISTVPDTSSAFITWTGAANAANYEIRYREIGTTALSFVSPSGPSTTLTGLQPNTCYEFSVRTICGASNASDWVRGPDFCTVTGPVCQDPANIAVAPDTLSAALTWTGDTNAMGYEIRYREIGTTALSFVSPSGPSATLMGLMPNTCYEYSIRTICGPNRASDWVRGPDFCTLSGPICGLPAGITATPSSTSAALNWMSASQAVNYEIRYREIGTTALSFVSPTGPSATLTGLLPATCYEFSVRTICGPNEASDWVRGPDFCTNVPNEPMGDSEGDDVAIANASEASNKWPASALPTVRLAPNPVIDRLNIQLEGGAAPYQLRLTHISGQLVEHTTIQGSTQLDLSNLHTGVYLLQIRSDQSDAWQTFKLIKQ